MYFRYLSNSHPVHRTNPKDPSSSSPSSSPIASHMRQLTWSKDAYEISTDHTRIPISQLNQAFSSSDLHWAIPLSDEVMSETLRNSLCFGVYHHSNSQVEFMGFARCITDFVTFLYLTDVYVWPAHQGKGIGTWLVSCVREVMDSMPYLRKCMALTSSWDRSVPFYDRLMGMKVVGGRDPNAKEDEVGNSGTGGGSLAVLSVNGRGAVI